MPDCNRRWIAGCLQTEADTVTIIGAPIVTHEIRVRQHRR